MDLFPVPVGHCKFQHDHLTCLHLQRDFGNLDIAIFAILIAMLTGFCVQSFDVSLSALFDKNSFRIDCKKRVFHLGEFSSEFSDFGY